MHAKVFLSALGGLALVSAQAMGPAPSPSFLSATQSGVLPIEPTPFAGVETIEGAITYDGPPIIGFTGPGGNATVQQNTPGVSYMAVLPPTNFDNATGAIITGTITGTVPPNGTGVMFTVNFSGFPSEAMYGPFVYHIHALPVAPNGNCTATMGHLDPTDRGELHACEMAAPQTCQTGDLAGKHGNITASPFSATYLDPYVSTNPNSSYFFGTSIVIHSMNTTRLTCANFTLVSTAPATTTTATATAATTTAAMFTGAAAVVSNSVGTFGVRWLLCLHFCCKKEIES